MPSLTQSKWECTRCSFVNFYDKTLVKCVSCELIPPYVWLCECGFWNLSWYCESFEKKKYRCYGKRQLKICNKTQNVENKTQYANRQDCEIALYNEMFWRGQENPLSKSRELVLNQDVYYKFLQNYLFVSCLPEDILKIIGTYIDYFVVVDEERLRWYGSPEQDLYTLIKPMNTFPSNDNEAIQKFCSELNELVPRVCGTGYVAGFIFNLARSLRCELIGSWSLNNFLEEITRLVLFSSGQGRAQKTLDLEESICFQYSPAIFMQNFSKSQAGHLLYIPEFVNSIILLLQTLNKTRYVHDLICVLKVTKNTKDEKAKFLYLTFIPRICLMRTILWWQVEELLYNAKSMHYSRWYQQAITFFADNKLGLDKYIKSMSQTHGDILSWNRFDFPKRDNSIRWHDIRTGYPATILRELNDDLMF